MVTAQTTAGATEADNGNDRQTEILEAALACFAQLGIARTSIQDVADAARVSRGTVYRYFGDRQVLIDEAVKLGAQHYYADAAAAMAKQDSLEKQLGAMAQVVAKTANEHRTHSRILSGDAELVRNIVAGGDDTVRRTTEFLQPYVEAARSRGEVRQDVDVRAASEWLARIMHSLSNVQASAAFDIEKPRTVARFVEQFAVVGLR